jgi:hypothetical protein
MAASWLEIVPVTEAFCLTSHKNRDSTSVHVIPWFAAAMRCDVSCDARGRDEQATQTSSVPGVHTYELSLAIWEITPTDARHEQHAKT